MKEQTMKTTMKSCTLFLGALAAYGQTVSLSDTLTNAVGGGSFTGRVTVTLNSPGNASPLYYSTTSLTGWQAVYCLGVTGADCTTTTAAGAFAATLYANSTITPAGTSYSARFQPTKGSPWSETWTVEASDTKLYQVRSTAVPSPTVTFQPSQLALAAGSLVYGSSAGVGTALAAGTNGHILTLSGGYPTWAASTGGVTSITGTANQITASASTGAVTLSLPATITGLTSVTSTGFTGALTGNASTATALAGALTTGQVLYGQGTGVPTSESALFWDATNDRLGVGTASPAQTVDFRSAGSGAGVLRIQSGSTGGYSALDAYDSSSVLQASFGYGNSAAAVFTSQVFVGSRSNVPMVFLINTTERARFAATTGNLLIGGTTDGNYKLDVQSSGSTGTLRVRDQGGAGSTLAVIQAGASQGTNNLTEWKNNAGVTTGFIGYAGAFASNGGGVVIRDTAPPTRTDISIAPGSIVLASGSLFKFSSTNDAPGTPDTAIARNAAGVLEINNGTAGTLRDLYLRRERFEAVAVSNLPAAASWPGTVQYVTDANATTIGSVVAAGGSNKVLVWSNGTDWKIYAN